jgi:hypothetical protein
MRTPLAAGSAGKCRSIRTQGGEGGRLPLLGRGATPQSPSNGARHQAARTSIYTGGRVTGNGSSRPSPRHDGTGVVSAAGSGLPTAPSSPPGLRLQTVGGAGLPDPKSVGSYVRRLDSGRSKEPCHADVLSVCGRRPRAHARRHRAVHASQAGDARRSRRQEVSATGPATGLGCQLLRFATGLCESGRRQASLLRAVARLCMRLHVSGSAEREGFEPSRELAPSTRLAGECLQPLGHLSVRGPMIDR